MEYRQDYLEGQMDIVSKMLRRLLEKLLKVEPSAVNDEEINAIVSSGIVANREVATIDTLSAINDPELIATLKNEYGYNDENIKLLADVFYALAHKTGNTTAYNKKSLILYRHYLQESKSHIDFLVFGRVGELEQQLG